MPVCLASQTRICLAYREFRTHLLGLLQSPDSVPAQPPFETSPLASSLSSDSLQNCFSWLLCHSMPQPLHICRPSFVLMFLRVLSALLVHINFVFHMSSTVFGSRGFRSASPGSDRPAQPFGIPYCSQLRRAPLSFKKQLKTHLFASAFPSSWIFLDAPLIRWSPFIYLFGCPWFCACLNVCYYYYYYLLL